ncbi:NAD-dependent epimerase/dehydratase family protein [Chloroflexota bacterium]
MKALITGAAGFLGGYLVEDLINHGYDVIGLDNFSKYGIVTRAYDSDSKYRFVEGDAKDLQLLKELIIDCDQFIALAAVIGGIPLFHEYPYDLLAENERIAATAFDAAIWAHRKSSLKRIVVISSSMVFESAEVFPTPEGEQMRCPPPQSTYGFQKLACEYFAKGAWEQYKLPYTIIRPFNLIGVGEKKARLDKEVTSGNIKLAMSHVIPDLVQKVLKGQDPLRILGSGDQIRCFTYGGDLARGIRLCLESEKTVNEDLNISNPLPTTILELAQIIWNKINKDKPFRYSCDEPYTYDVKKRIPSVEKAKKLVGFEATTKLEDALDEIIPWIKKEIELGGI